MNSIDKTKTNIAEINNLLDILTLKLIEFKKEQDILKDKENKLNKREERIIRTEKIQKEYVKNKEEMFRKMNNDLISRKESMRVDTQN